MKKVMAAAECHKAAGEARASASAGGRGEPRDGSQRGQFV
jgi:hypothetical protein